MVLHAIGRSDPPGITNPWIAKHIFPGGYIPALSEVFVGRQHLMQQAVAGGRAPSQTTRRIARELGTIAHYVRLYHILYFALGGNVAACAATGDAAEPQYVDRVGWGLRAQ